MEERIEKRRGMLGSRHDRPVPIGATIKTMIERQARNPSTVTYTLEVTVLEVLRGEEAWDRIKTEGVSEKAAEPGFEYLMARLRLNYSPKARGLPEYEPYLIEEKQFGAFSQDGRTRFETPPVLKQPHQNLIGLSISANKSVEGWIVLKVPAGEKEPLLVFDRDYTESRLTLRTARGLLWFKLYQFDPMKIDSSCTDCI